jgi:hypothetical protein
MGFPRDIRSLEGLNQLLDALEEERHRELEERQSKPQERPASDESPTERRATGVLVPGMEMLLGHLICRMQGEYFAQFHRQRDL